MSTVHDHNSLFVSESYSDGSYSSDDEGSPRDRPMVITSTGFKDFCIKNVKLVSYGQKEIQMAEKGINLATCTCMTCKCTYIHYKFHVLIHV